DLRHLSSVDDPGAPRRQLDVRVIRVADHESRRLSLKIRIGQRSVAELDPVIEEPDCDREGVASLRDAGVERMDLGDAGLIAEWEVQGNGQTPKGKRTQVLGSRRGRSLGGWAQAARQCDADCPVEAGGAG